MVLFYLLAVVLGLVGCGSQPKPADAAGKADVSRPAPELNPGGGAALPPPDPKDKRHVVVCFGDSLTAGYGAPAGSSYPDFLQKLIEADRLPWRVVNAGISGETTTGGLTRIETIIAQKPDILVLELGGNDGLRGLPLSTTKQNLSRIIEQLSKTKARIVLAGMTLPPNYGPEYIRDFEAMYRDLAMLYQLKLVPFLLAPVTTPDRMMLQPDGIHPTAEGNKLVASYLYKQYLERMMAR